jgi:hypothetical protein
VIYISFIDDACVLKKSLFYKVGCDCFMWRFCASVFVIGRPSLECVVHLRFLCRIRKLGTPCVGFEVLTAVVMKSTLFWDITPYSLLKVNRRFGETYRLHLQVWRIIRARNQRESGWFLTRLISTLKIEEICSSETSVDLQRTTGRCIQEESTLRDYLFEHCLGHNPCHPHSLPRILRSSAYGEGIRLREDLQTGGHYAINLKM